MYGLWSSTYKSAVLGLLIWRSLSTSNIETIKTIKQSASNNRIKTQRRRRGEYHVHLRMRLIFDLPLHTPLADRRQVDTAMGTVIDSRSTVQKLNLASYTDGLLSQRLRSAVTGVENILEYRSTAKT